MRREWVAIAVIAVTALVVRVYPARSGVLGGTEVNFLENDAWYHLRLVENQVQNYPWRVTVDPFAAPGGQFVPIPPLFDTVISTVVVLGFGSQADTASIARVAAWMPPALGLLTVIAVWRVGRLVFGVVAGVVAAGLTAIMPGHFLDRTMLGFVDHHALEALLIVLLLWSLAAAISPTAASRRAVAWAGLRTGVVIGLYLLAWSSGSLMLAVIAMWAIVVSITRVDARVLAAVIGQGACWALAMVLVFQDPRMHRYESQVLALVGLIGLSIVLLVLARIPMARRRLLLAASGIAGAAAVVTALTLMAPGTLEGVVIDIARLAPDPSRRGVLEARPLMFYSGAFDWRQPWLFFRGGFYLGLAALVLFIPRLWRTGRASDWLLWTVTASMFVITLGQNRFGYYLVPACALMGGWLTHAVLEWGRQRASTPRATVSRRLLSSTAVVAMLASALAPRDLVTKRPGLMPPFWRDAMRWLAEQTPPAFGAFGDDYYVARYRGDTVPSPDFTVMTWWDQGYWVAARARRVPVANPTQARAQTAARFYAETEARSALEMLRTEHVGIVVSDWELPFRMEGGRIMGRFQSVLDWAGKTHGDYYSVAYRRVGRVWEPVWLFHPAYYRSMAFRLTVLGGAAAEPRRATSVLTLVERKDSTGRPFEEIESERTYATHTAAVEVAAASRGSGRTVVVGLDPWRAAFPVDALESLDLAYEARTSGQSDTEAPWVRAYRVRPHQERQAR